MLNQNKSSYIENQTSQNEFLKKFGIHKSFLTYHNFGSTVSEFLEIRMPYMLLYEFVDIEKDKSITFEFTECRKNYIFSTLSELNEFSSRPVHSHDFYELTVVLSGQVNLQIENEIVTYSQGDCCLCNRNIHHKELLDSSFEILLFMFKEDYIKSLLESDIQYNDHGESYIKHNFLLDLLVQNEKTSFYTAKEYVDFKKKDTLKSEQFFDVINNILKEINDKEVGSSYFIKGYLCRFLNILNDTTYFTIQSHHAKLSKEETLMYQVLRMIEESKGSIKRDELENKLNYNADYLNRIIKKYTGMTLLEHARIFMLNEAAYMLRHTNIKIIEICERLGYSNRSHFNKLFVKRFHMTPIQYRKQTK